MKTQTLDQEIRAAIQFADDHEIAAEDRAEMLMQIAMRVQMSARDPADLESAIELYQRARDTCPNAHPLQTARIRARMATVLQSMPDETGDALCRARAIYDDVRPRIAEEGEKAELAELDMNRGLVLQSLAAINKATMPQAISAYQDALRHFDKHEHPRDYAILHNNLATAFLSLTSADPQSKMREALAVQSFEDALSVIRLDEHPLEYAMLQNNLGNALQQVGTGHALENRQRAVDAYNEALKVRTREHTPLPYATTLANRAECIATLAQYRDDENQWLHDALADFRTALQIYQEHGEPARAQIVAEAVQALSMDLGISPETTEVNQQPA